MVVSLNSRLESNKEERRPGLALRRAHVRLFIYLDVPLFTYLFITGQTQHGHHVFTSANALSKMGEKNLNTKKQTSADSQDA